MKRILWLAGLVLLPVSLLFAAGDEDVLLMEIPSVITASKVAEKLTDAPGVITVVTKDDIQRFGGTTLSDILDHVPGLMKTTHAITDRSMVSIRGAQFKDTAVHTLLLINGRPVRGEALEGGIISEVLGSFPVNIIERIEVIRGPGSVLYGSGAFDGVINIITEKAENNDVTVSALGGTGTDVMAKGKYKSGDTGVVVAGKYHQKGDREVNLHVFTFPPSWDHVEKVKFTDKGPGAYAEVEHKNFKLMTSMANWDYMSFLPDIGFLFANHPGWGNITYQKKWADAGYTRKVNDTWDMSFNVTYMGSTLELSDFPTFKRDSFGLTGEWTNYIRPTDRLNVVLGASYNYLQGKEADLSVTPSPVYSDHDQRSYCVYTQLDYWISPDKVKVIGGVQSNTPENVAADVVPRLGFIFYPVPDINVKTLYSQAFRAPSINENFLRNPNLWGVSTLKSEKVDTTEVAVSYFKNNVELGLSYFTSQQKNLIAANRTGGATSLGFYENANDIDQKGVEFEGKYNLNREFLLVGSVLSQQSKDKNGVENMSPTPSTSGKIGISYKSDKGATVSLFDSYQGALDKKYASTTNVSPDEAYNMASLHARLDMTKLAGWNIGKNFAFMLQIDNLLDKELWLPGWGISSGLSLPVNPGRVVYLGVEIAL